VETLFESDGVPIAGHLARPRFPPGTTVPALVITHGMPHASGGGRLSAGTFPELAERIAGEMGWMALVINFRGCGDSSGDFSLRGWLDDLLAAARFLRGLDGVKGVWTSGFGTGGALSICAAAHDSGIRGVAAMGAPADFDDWASHPRRLLQHARDTGIIRQPTFPPQFEPWAREIREVRAIAAIDRVAPRPLLVLHGSEDDVVPVFDARVLADAHGDADLRIVEGAGHQLRHDPRAVSILLGWLDRQRNLTATERSAEPAP
jgi:fermentation-respiration switch protein FrsA (DUF1100 family)